MNYDAAWNEKSKHQKLVSVWDHTRQRKEGMGKVWVGSAIIPKAMAVKEGIEMVGSFSCCRVLTSCWHARALRRKREAPWRIQDLFQEMQEIRSTLNHEMLSIEFVEKLTQLSNWETDQCRRDM